MSVMTSLLFAVTYIGGLVLALVVAGVVMHVVGSMTNMATGYVAALTTVGVCGIVIAEILFRVATWHWKKK